MWRARSPSFRRLASTSQAASKVMARNGARGTTCETLLCAELRRMGLTFSRNVVCLPGKPDIVFVGQQLAVFCDGDFWHGRRWKVRREKLARGSNADYWVAKIEANIARDKRHRANLRRAGWRVIRLWESDILGDPKRVTGKIADALFLRQETARFMRSE